MTHIGGDVVFEREGFSFRLFTPDDLPDLVPLYGSTAAVQYLRADGHAWTEDDLLRQVARWADEFHDVGYTKWRVDTVEGEFIGRAGLSPMPGNRQEAELGYCIRQDLWGKGFATRLATIVRDWAWANTSLPFLIAMTRLGNLSSQRVLRKIGMTPTGQRFHDGSTCAFFRIDRP
jgi:RimJ/RimL family protein N-acetyltransferase